MHRALSRVGQATGAANEDTTAGLGALFGTDVRHVLSAAAEMVEDQLAARGITLMRTYAANLPPLAGDASALERVFVNLLVNARDAMTGRTGRVTISAEGGTDRDGDIIIVRVRDEGHGIAESVRARLFEPNVTTKVPHARRGLGLTICREIVERQGGSIDVEAVEGQGTCFRVVLPALRLPRPDAAS
jgi:signal transduction histidine kinase